MSMPKGRPLTFYEREKIETYLRMKKKKTWIAKKLNRDYSIIKREIKRNSGSYLPYSAITAQRLADERSRKTNVKKLDKTKNIKLKEFVEEKLNLDWSPEQVSFYLKENVVEGITEIISYESIYAYIYHYAEKYKELLKHLRTGRKKRQRRFYRKKQGNIIKDRVSIHARPEVVNDKKEYGHWETDLMEFKKQKEVLSVKYERKSMLCRLHRLKSKKAAPNEESIVEVIESFPHYWFKSVTRDNGSENARHQDTFKDFDIISYFCDPYCSWQKGGIENLNKLIRQYLPKDCDLSKISNREIYEIQERLNDRPRKSNNYLTPNEVYALNS